MKKQIMLLIGFYVGLSLLLISHVLSLTGFIISVCSVSIIIAYEILFRKKLVTQTDLMQKKELSFHSAFNISQMGMGIFSLDGRCIEANQALTKLFGMRDKQFKNLDMEKILHPDEIKNHSSVVKSMVESQMQHVELLERFVNHKGDILWVMVTLSLIYDNNKKALHFIVEMRDVTGERTTEEKLRYLAYHDALTGLLNRNKLEAHLSDVMSTSQRQRLSFALIILDLDHFKNVNDVMGHESGDLLLRVIAERLKNTVRDTDIVARLGGDEFVIVITQLTELDPVTTIVQKVVENISKPIVIRGNEIYMTSSIGISVYPHDGHDIQTLMKNADLALYRAKEIGRNNFQFCTQEMTAKSREKMQKQNALVQALAKNEFSLHYQPKLNLQYQLINGVEALLRWENTEYSNVSPREIISLAEESGLIVPLNEWVIRQACEQAKKWQDKGLDPVTISINLSARQFKQTNLADTVMAILEESNLSPSFLELEITESLIMKDPDLVMRTLQQLKMTGVRITIDDFGTGYSSLEYMRRFNIDSIKIDKQFIQHMLHDQTYASIVKAIVAMAKKLNIKTIAEGVETREQYEFLLKEKCTEIQGFYLSPPLDEGNLIAFLKNPVIISALSQI